MPAVRDAQHKNMELTVRNFIYNAVMPDADTVLVKFST